MGWKLVTEQLEAGHMWGEWVKPLRPSLARATSAFQPIELGTNSSKCYGGQMGLPNTQARPVLWKTLGDLSSVAFAANDFHLKGLETAGTLEGGAEWVNPLAAACSLLPTILPTASNSMSWKPAAVKAMKAGH